MSAHLLNNAYSQPIRAKEWVGIPKPLWVPGVEVNLIAPVSSGSPSLPAHLLQHISLALDCYMLLGLSAILHVLVDFL